MKSKSQSGMKVNDMKERLCPNVEVDRMLNELKEILPTGYFVARRHSFLSPYGNAYIIEIYRKWTVKRQKRKWIFSSSIEEEIRQMCVARIILPIRDVSEIDIASIAERGLYSILKPFLEKHNCRILYKCWESVRNEYPPDIVEEKTKKRKNVR